MCFRAELERLRNEQQVEEDRVQNSEDDLYSQHESFRSQYEQEQQRLHDQHRQLLLDKEQNEIDLRQAQDSSNQNLTDGAWNYNSVHDFVHLVGFFVSFENFFCSQSLSQDYTQQ